MNCLGLRGWANLRPVAVDYEVLEGDHPRLRRRSYWESVVALIAHLAGTGVIFVAFILLGWVVTYILVGLHTLHPFPEEIFRLITRIELGLIYVDAGLCAIVLFAGMAKFCRDIVGAQR